MTFSPSRPPTGRRTRPQGGFPVATALGLLCLHCLLFLPRPATGQERTDIQPTDPVATVSLQASTTPRVPLHRFGADRGDGAMIVPTASDLSIFGRESDIDAGGPGPGTSFLASLVAPGSSQWMHGQRRTYLYLGVELAGWIGFLQGRHQGADARDAYRETAWTYAAVGDDRDGFSGGFAFYETLGQWTTSGDWDADPAMQGLQPETDPETYNGSIWQLASELYLSGEGAGSDPEARQMALLYYRDRAYPPEQAWDWSGNSGQLDRYRDLIERSDDSFRRATVILGAVVANHLLSAVDAYLSTRISSERSVRLSSDLASDARPFGRSRAMRWTFELSFNPFP